MAKQQAGQGGLEPPTYCTCHVAPAAGEEQLLSDLLEMLWMVVLG